MYQDSEGVFYIHEETASPTEPEKKAPVWPWVLAGAAIVAGTALWMSQNPPQDREPCGPTHQTPSSQDLNKYTANPITSQRANPGLWNSIKKKILFGDKGGKSGQWSARKAQLAVQEYKKKGGKYIGKKDKANSLVRWTNQKWRTRSGKPSLETGERYLPEKAILSLSEKEYKATSRAKKRGMKQGKQFVKQPSQISKKVKKFRI